VGPRRENADGGFAVARGRHIRGAFCPVLRPWMSWRSADMA
jgi:hypothetical protein